MTVRLHWIPLGAGGHVVRWNGIAYEALAAGLARRPRCDLYHSALVLELDGGRWTVEMTPVPDGRGHERGVVAEGPVGSMLARRLRIFRYEVRRWRDGVVPDLGFTVGDPVVVEGGEATARRVFDILPEVPTLTWGRDELGAGEMWSCNSITSWALTAAGVDIGEVPLPPRGRAPGWDAGRIAAATGPGPGLRSRSGV